MLTFEVTVPPDHAGGAQIRMTLDAEHWMEAWGLALAELGEPVPSPDRVTCRIGHDGAVEVIVPESGRRLFIQSTTPRGTRGGAAGTAGVPADVPPIARPATERARIRRVTRAPETTASPAAPVLNVPAATGGAGASAGEALAMLQRHVRCAELLLWSPAPDGRGWILHSARGLDSRFAPGLLLREAESVVSALERGPGRRTFVGAGATLRCTRGFGRRLVVSVRSAVWAPVVAQGDTVGLILLLNAERPSGFTDPELSAVEELSQTLGARLEHARIGGFD